MNDSQTRRLNMSRKVQKLHSDNPTIVSAVPAYAAAATELADLNKSILDVAGKQDQEISGITTGKNNDRHLLEEKLAEGCSIGYAYADQTDNDELRAAFDLSPSFFSHLKEVKMETVYTNIHKLLKDNLTPSTNVATPTPSFKTSKMPIPATKALCYCPAPQKPAKQFQPNHSHHSTLS